MIDETDRQLAGWIGTILDKVNVSLAPPGPPDSAKGVGLYLMELVPAQVTRGTRRPPVLMTLRYLVTTQAPKAEDAHQMLGALVLAALENPDFEVEQEPLPLLLWTTLGTAPRTMPLEPSGTFGTDGTFLFLGSSSNGSRLMFAPPTLYQ